MSRRAVDRGLVEKGVELILRGIGADLGDENFRDTPRRYADFLEELLSPKISDEDYRYFTQTGELVLVAGIRAYSLCPHHLLPVIYDVSVAYRPRDRVVGISKIIRVVMDKASYPVLQERLTEEVADAVRELTGSDDVFVLVEGRHFCTIMRGVKTNALVTTVAVRGVFREERWRTEVLTLLSRQAIGPATLSSSCREV